MSESLAPIARTVRDLRKAVARWRNAGEVVGLVPTMGALHEGHLSLVTLLRERNARVIASVFVNPKQFAANEDLERYPRDEARDAALLAQVGCDLLYAPELEAIYPPGHVTTVQVGGIAGHLEGQSRPHFFGGVATVVTKLLLQSLPDLAAFGEKDYQQLIVIKRLVKDLDLPVEVIAGETVREADGLAMSSRNAYLSPEHRQIAPRLYALLMETAGAISRGSAMHQSLVRLERALFKAGFEDIDYVAVRAADDFQAIASPIITRPARLLAAVRLGGVRLIDNVAVRPATY